MDSCCLNHAWMKYYYYYIFAATLTYILTHNLIAYNTQIFFFVKVVVFMDFNSFQMFSPLDDVLKMVTEAEITALIIDCDLSQRKYRKSRKLGTQ